MTAPLLWIILPILWGSAALFLRDLKERLFPASAVFSLLLAWIAWQFPIDSTLESGRFALRISSTLIILGRNFTLLNVDRPMIALMYLALSLWFLAGFFARPNLLFVGTAQIVVGLLIAALSVEPFLYAALLIAVAVLLSVPMLAPPGRSHGPGLMRFVSFQLFGLPFILFVGWLLTGVEASPSNLSLVLRAGILVALGFAFLQAVFPFHSWIPMLAGESNPYVVGFLLCFLPMTVSIFGLGFIDRYAWLRDTQLVFQMLFAVGAVVCFLGGTWAAIQNHLGRMLGFAVVFEIGLSLLALGLSGAEAVQFTFALIPARIIALLVASIALSGLLVAAGRSLLLDDLAGIIRFHPFLLIGFVLSILTFGALPLTVGFAPKAPLLARVWQISPWAAAAAMLGACGLLTAGLRTLYSLAPPLLAGQLGLTQESLLAKPNDSVQPDRTNPYAWLYLAISVFSILALGLVPQILYGTLAQFLAIFPQLGP
ncbi:MAG: hypothetical protein DWG76_06940 [Chloroflexi bacterium]|nr:hypothetical protein [Chloroflexota bacterium]